jgi:hypothetical protein
MMEAVRTSETSVYTNTALYHRRLTSGRENLKSHMLRRMLGARRKQVTGGYRK